MLGNSGKAASVVTVLKPASAANTSAATSAGIDITSYEGDLVFIQHVGVVTAGTVDGKLQVCDDAGGTNPVDVTGATFTQVTTSNDDPNIQKLVWDSGSFAKKFVRYVGTIGTGPALMSVTLVARPKYLD